MRQADTSEREPQSSDAPLDRLLEGLRACGDDQYRADADDLHRWTAYCPCCASELIGARSLSIRELGSGRVLLECWRGCRREQILGAIRMAEAAWESPAGLELAKAELERIREAERLAHDLKAADGIDPAAAQSLFGSAEHHSPLASDLARASQ